MRILLLLVLAAQAAAAPAALDARVKSRIAGFKGKVSLFAKNLDTGATYGLAPDDPVRTASTIKLPIMIECFFEAQEGKLDWSEAQTLARAEKVSGSGVLTEFTDGDAFPLRDLMHLMIVLSDNTATNLVLNRVHGDAVNARMESLGLTQTRDMRKILSDGPPSGVTQEGAKPENARWGLGRTTPREMVTLLEKIYRGQLVSPGASQEMLAVLKRQQYHDGIARDLKDVTVASKSGALDALRSDVGIVYTRHGDFAMAITVDDMPGVDWSNDNPGNLLISSLSEILIEGLEKPMSQTEHHDRIDYIELPAGDILATKKFYHAAFSWDFTDYGPAYSSFSDGRLAGGFTTDAKVSSGAGPLIVLYSKDLEDTLNKVTAAGGKITKPIFSFPGGRRFHFTDPAGNELAVWSE
jgi:beta-lactamase class A